VDCRARRAWHIPALHGLIVRDVTGAGDGFSGGFMAALSDGREPVDAACWGTVAASFVVESVGALMPPHFSRDRMNARYVHVREGVTEMETIDSVGGRPVRDG
jgi:sugar/nucleoside kinase (ribokinase family)